MSTQVLPGAGTLTFPIKNVDACLHITNLDTLTTESLLWELFLRCGPLQTINIHRDKVHNAHMGAATVEYKTTRDADYATLIMNGIKLYGKIIRVSKSQASTINQTYVDQNVISYDGLVKIRVGNLSPDVTEIDLRYLFSKFGPILQSSIATDKDTGERLTYAMIVYNNFESGDNAIARMNGQFLADRQLTVGYALKNRDTGEFYGNQTDRLLLAKAEQNMTVMTQQVDISQMSGIGMNANQQQQQQQQYQQQYQQQFYLQQQQPFQQQQPQQQQQQQQPQQQSIDPQQQSSEQQPLTETTPSQPPTSTTTTTSTTSTELPQPPQPPQPPSNQQSIQFQQQPPQPPGMMVPPQFNPPINMQQFPPQMMMMGQQPGIPMSPQMIQYMMMQRQQQQQQQQQAMMMNQMNPQYQFLLQQQRQQQQQQMMNFNPFAANMANIQNQQMQYQQQQFMQQQMQQQQQLLQQQQQSQQPQQPQQQPQQQQSQNNSNSNSSG